MKEYINAHVNRYSRGLPNSALYSGILGLSCHSVSPQRTSEDTGFVEGFVVFSQHTHGTPDFQYLQEEFRSKSSSLGSKVPFWKIFLYNINILLHLYIDIHVPCSLFGVVQDESIIMKRYDTVSINEIGKKINSIFLSILINWTVQPDQT